MLHAGFSFLFVLTSASICGLGCSVLSSYQLKLWCNRRDTSVVLDRCTHQIHQVTSKRKQRKGAFGIPLKINSIEVYEVLILG